jgi:hypothetical protein
MKRLTKTLAPVALTAAVVLLCSAPGQAAVAATDATAAERFAASLAPAAEPAPLMLAGAPGDRELDPRYHPAEPQSRSSYNDAYIFGLTRGVADSTMHPAVKVLLFPLTVPLDLVFLPFSAIGGAFG